MSKREREFKRSFNEEKARVKLYKSGKNWVKAGIKEIKLLGILGLPILARRLKKRKKKQNAHLGTQ